MLKFRLAVADGAGALSCTGLLWQSLHCLGCRPSSFRSDWHFWFCCQFRVQPQAGTFNEDRRQKTQPPFKVSSELHLVVDLSLASRHQAFPVHVRPDRRNHCPVPQRRSQEQIPPHLPRLPYSILLLIRTVAQSRCFCWANLSVPRK